MLLPSLQEGLWGLSGGPSCGPWYLLSSSLGCPSTCGCFHTRNVDASLHFSAFFRAHTFGLNAAPLAERRVSVATVQLVEEAAAIVRVIPAAFQPPPPRRSTEGRKAGQREGVRTFITSWGFTGDAHMHAGAHTHTPHRVDFTVEKCADLQ